MPYKICECCGKSVRYGFPGEKPTHCRIKKLHGMIDVVSRRCIVCGQGCSFGWKGQKRTHCGDCKLEGMINVKHKTCENCDTIATFGFIGKKATHCGDHQLEGMIDVKNIKCELCDTTAVFGFKGNKPKRCDFHKLIDMINVTAKRCPLCDRHAIYGYEGKSPTHCFHHQLPFMIDLIHKTCIGQNGKCPIQIRSNKYDGYCTFCFSHYFPNDPRTNTIRQRTKELKVRDFLNENYSDFIHDKSIITQECDCSIRRRIDHRVLIGNTYLCVETDEHQHKYGYNTEKEKYRYDDLFYGESFKYVFIRFNPDSYRDRNNKIMTTRINIRLNKLKSEINRQMKRIENEENTEIIEITKLYYDET